MKSHVQTARPSRATPRGGCLRSVAVAGDSTAVPRLPACRRRFANCARRQRRGTAAVEFAVVLPILVTLLLGATDFGRFSYSAIAVANAARSGAAYGSMNPFTTSSLAVWQAAVKQAAIDELSQASAFDTSKLTVTVTSTVESSGMRRVSVQTTYPFKTKVNWLFIPSSFNLTHTVVMRGIR